MLSLREASHLASLLNQDHLNSPHNLVNFLFGKERISICRQSQLSMRTDTTQSEQVSLPISFLPADSSST
jgi:hypothetical protein